MSYAYDFCYVILAIQFSSRSAVEKNASCDFLGIFHLFSVGFWKQGSGVYPAAAAMPRIAASRAVARVAYVGPNIKESMSFGASTHEQPAVGSLVQVVTGDCDRPQLTTGSTYNLARRGSTYWLNKPTNKQICARSQLFLNLCLFVITSVDPVN